ncbi:4-hydroxy-tetrahydrodipicolinate reductase [Halothermothrix orenii]|uniref:4-hydroxy-tetrahydrodipicolinate reductase n=1 Tax=Halothermothrix orenii (strain H 168 / OCM 544 / DSM 9562) TaxID=373903 RepID=B8CWF1_HALOH|nr:4-hydroxy-tetrahydrodipicolinate reductase [Halothermothrix orenii]ACL69620.1 Dihydrodipicolinate reductase [Halothermothrix orenii H 168]
MKRVLVNGAMGKMGQEVVKTVVEETEDLLVGACDMKGIGENIMDLLGLKGDRVTIYGDLTEAIQKTNPDVIIDFTIPEVVMNNIKTGLSHKVHMIVGTTGITEVDLKEIKDLAEANNVNALIVPNFAIGAVLMMEFSREAARYFKDVEIIELHHNQKIDAPSGTSIKTAELINRNMNNCENNGINEIERIKGARGGNKNGVNIHSVRLPGLVAHQEVIFGGEGQTLTIRHDSYSRKSFMPGVKLALKKITDINGLVYGLEKIL